MDTKILFINLFLWEVNRYRGQRYLHLPTIFCCMNQKYLCVLCIPTSFYYLFHQPEFSLPLFSHSPFISISLFSLPRIISLFFSHSLALYLSAMEFPLIYFVMIIQNMIEILYFRRNFKRNKIHTSFWYRSGFMWRT